MDPQEEVGLGAARKRLRVWGTRSLLAPWGSFGKKAEVYGVRGLALPGRGREKHRFYASVPVTITGEDEGPRTHR